MFRKCSKNGRLDAFFLAKEAPFLKKKKDITVQNDPMTQEPLILAIETSGRAGSVALAVGATLLAETAFSGTMKHSSQVFPTITDLLDQFKRKPGQIRQIYISVGPGSFTGLRIAVTIAKTMHLANKVKIAGVDTLDAIAANIDDYTPLDSQPRRIAVVLDAKRKQFFTAVYEQRQEQWTKTLPDCLMTTDQFRDRCATEPISLLGEGLLYYADAFKDPNIEILPESLWTPRAAKVHLLGWKMALKGQFDDPLTFQPAYLRRPEAEEKWQKRQINKGS